MGGGNGEEEDEKGIDWLREGRPCAGRIRLKKQDEQGEGCVCVCVK